MAAAAEAAAGLDQNTSAYVILLREAAGGARPPSPPDQNRSLQRLTRAKATAAEDSPKPSKRNAGEPEGFGAADEQRHRKETGGEEVGH